MEGESSPIDLPRACPSCLGTMTFAFEKNGYSIFCCDTCGNGAVDGEFGASHVKDNYDDKYFFGGGAGYPDYLSEAGLLRDQGMRYGQLLCKYAKPGRLLDVGSAVCLPCFTQIAGPQLRDAMCSFRDVRRRLRDVGFEPRNSIMFLLENNPIDWSFSEAGSVKSVLGL